jgi:hypothetical protein
MAVTWEQAQKILNLRALSITKIHSKSVKEDTMLSGQVQQVKREGDRVALKVGGSWYSAFTNSDRMDDATRGVLAGVVEGQEVSLEIYENKGFKNIGAATWLAPAEGGEAPKPKPLSPSESKPAWGGKSGGGGYKAYPPAEVEAAKQASFSMSYSKDVVVALIASKDIVSVEAAGDALQSIAFKIFETMKGLK